MNTLNKFLKEQKLLHTQPELCVQLRQFYLFKDVQVDILWLCLRVSRHIGRGVWDRVPILILQKTLGQSLSYLRLYRLDLDHL